MKVFYRYSFIVISISFLMSSCKKDSVSDVKSYAGVYVGDVTEVEGSMPTTTVIKNCTIIITPTDNSGQVTVEADKIFFTVKIIGNINGSNLTLTQKETNNGNTISSKSYGSASFSANTMSIDFKQDDYLNGKLYYQSKWTGTLKK
jgi:hypothetical protein